MQRDDEQPNEEDDLPAGVEDADMAGGVESWLADAARISHADRRELLPAKLPTPGTVVDGKYDLGEVIGEGSMGAVFSATHLVTHKPVAVKWMLRSAHDEAALKRFTREAYAACRVDHPNVVNVFDIGRQGDSSFLVMERLRGQSLRARLRGGPLPVEVALQLLLPAMRGVAAAHGAGVIHRDLKPDNIFLCQAPDGSAREAKVLDFGVSAVRTPEGANDPTLTEEGALLGTPSYMSPEALESATNADERSDVYAFGVIIYEALCGRLPFQADSHSALVLAIAGKSPPPLRAHCPDVPPSLESVVMRAMARQPGDRYPDVPALIDALTPFSIDAGPTAPSLGGGEPGGSSGTAGRLRWWVAAAVIAAVALSWLVTDHAPTRQPSAPAVTAAEAPPMAEPVAPTPTEVAATGAADAPADEAPSAAVDETPAPPGRANRATGRRQAPAPLPSRPADPVVSPPTKPPPATPRLPKARAGSISIDQL